MKKNVIKFFTTTALVLLLINLTGCKKSILPQGKEINDLQLVQVIGIDKLPGGSNDCLLTIASKNLEIGGEQVSTVSTGENISAGKRKALILTSTGKTIFEAVRKIQTHSNKTLFWGHSGYYLIGEEAARENIAKYIDFFTRDHELRIESKIYIVKGSARDLIEQFNQSDFYIYDKLESLGRNFKLVSISEEMKIHELMRFIDIHHASARVPCIYLVNREGEAGKEIKDIESYGYAIFKDLKLVGFIPPDISRGINLITNNVNTSIVVVKDIEGQDVSLEIIDSNTEVIPRFNGDNLESILIKAKVFSNLGEIQSQIDFTKEDSISYMESQQSEILETEMKSVLEKVLEFESDCLEICDRIRLKKPLKWHKIEDKWMEIFLNTKFDIQVESIIRRTYELREPSGYKKQENKNQRYKDN
ncbi:MAG TPA: Ger(x)C family spore germination protein [Clostridiaceae bacterium]|nr:Ger(x)C family spore germination protein [Clostridiaceae bacterium]